MVKDNKLYISEIFKSIDGEGFHAGQVTVFVRLFGCNLRCCWCDTKTTWTGEAHKRVYGHRPTWMTVQEIVDKVEELEQGWLYKSICLTGGEPLMEENKELVEQLIEDLISKGYGVNIETNGAVDYKYWLDMHVFPSLVDVYGNRTGMSLITDWKLPSSKMNHKMIQSNLKILRECDLIKCVISDDPEDWTAFEEQVCKSGTKAKIYLSPCFGKVTMSKIPEFVIAHPEYNISVQAQLHKIFWNPNKVGV